ncbi:MAG: patatin-like phospholipase family protein [Cyclobacteriaceae bacterium]|nr:patatin-like phospholipase family protein [Cyclobacteriaceae bacterium]MDW8330549.1 patatin-like phospholipase family protein [Cyclobacteriaceae bacterium]
MRRLQHFLVGFYYSFPIQLLLNNLKRNLILVLCWIILFAMITGNFGKYLGIPYLFLDPEYLNSVDFTSFFIMGCVTAGFTTAFHITTYIMDGHRFSFIGTLPKPFTRFALNNSIIPAVFLIVYVYQIIVFQINNQYTTERSVLIDLAGLFSGYLVTTLIFFIYFRFTNKDIFRYMVCRIDEKIKKNVGVTRASALKKLNIARKNQVRVDYYVDLGLRIKKVEDTGFYDRATVLQVFDQNHFNLVVIEVFIFIIVLLLGIFKDLPTFQLPAAASFTIFLTIFVMLAGAFEYWFGNWAATAGLVFFLIINHLAGSGFFSKKYEAFGLNYRKPPVEYTIENLRKANDSTSVLADKADTEQILNNWRKKFDPVSPPSMVLLCVSGGGKRAALWTFAALQHADSLTAGELMNRAVLITGASGGLVGASYFRELILRKKTGEPVNPYDPAYRSRISSDNLNPLIFSLLANDLFVGFTSFEYAGNHYERDRAYTFEDQLNQSTERMMDKPVSAYSQAEAQALVPMLILSPTIVNDGRKLYIASRPVSYMNMDIHSWPDYTADKIGGVDFHRMFSEHGSANLRFLSALRMCATFPYITPNTTLPTEPPIQIMDAGISDNFGLTDAIRFMFAFHEWIEKNTSGVILISIRDSPKLGTIPPQQDQSIVDAITQPISSVYNNFENFQDINSDLLLGHARKWFSAPLHRIDIQYQAENYLPILQGMDSIRHTSMRASLSWRLTEREKLSVLENLNSVTNKQQFEKLKNILQ